MSTDIVNTQIKNVFGFFFDVVPINIPSTEKLHSK